MAGYGASGFFKSPETLARKVAGWQAARARTHAGEGFIYLAEIVGSRMLKIGFSLNPDKRVHGIDCHPWGKRARLLAVMSGSWAQEKALHRSLRKNPNSPAGEYYRHSVLTHPALPAELRGAA